MTEQRQNKILELIEKNKVGTQNELCKLLSDEGFFVTQATVSRDIKLLNIVKKNRDGKSCYTERPNIATPEQKRYAKLFKEAVISIKYSGNLLVIKTMSGTANSAATLLDSLNYAEILGSVAGDDTIISVVESEIKTKKIANALLQLM